MSYDIIKNRFEFCADALLFSFVEEDQDMAKRYTQESFIENVGQINPNIEIISPFVKVTERIDVRCKQCGREWAPKAYYLLKGKGCSHCSAIDGAKVSKGKPARKTQVQFEEELKQISPSITVTGKYVNNKVKLEVRCNTCGSDWVATPNSLLLGHGCPRCAKSGTSFMEQFMLVTFRRILGQGAVFSRDKSLIGMELDIVVPSHNFAFEPGNWYFHSRNLKRDAKKREKCHDVGVRLITIYDQCPQDTKPPFDTDCHLFNIDLNSGNHIELKNLTLHLLNEMGASCNFSDEEWAEIEREAADASRAQTHDEFVERAKGVRPDVEVIGHFTNVNTRLSVRCRNCGNEWEVIPAQLLSGYGCRKCGTEKAHVKFRKTQNEFVEQLRLINPNIEVTGNYGGRHSKITVRCAICGNIWESTAGSLLSGRGCSICSRKQAAHKNRKSHEEFIMQLFDTNPNIEVLGTYDKMHSSINVQCKICKYEWSPLAGSLLAGQGCPICGRKQAANSNKRKVICVETGEVFPGATDAAKRIGVKSSSSIIQSIKHGCRSGGYHWKYLEDSTNDSQ